MLADCSEITAVAGLSAPGPLTCDRRHSIRGRTVSFSHKNGLSVITIRRRRRSVRRDGMPVLDHPAGGRIGRRRFRLGEVDDLGCHAARVMVTNNADTIHRSIAEPASQTSHDNVTRTVARAWAVFEANLAELSEADAREMLADEGLDDVGLDQLACVGFDALGLQTFLTAGPKEVHAWQIDQGWIMPQAAGVIHTDFNRLHQG